MIVKIIDNFLDDKYCQQLIDFFESNTDLQESYYGTTKITIFKAKKGRIIFFDSLFYRHGVTPVKKGPRYTLATWYKKI